MRTYPHLQLEPQLQLDPQLQDILEEDDLIRMIGRASEVALLGDGAHSTEEAQPQHLVFYIVALAHSTDVVACPQLLGYVGVVAPSNGHLSW